MDISGNVDQSLLFWGESSWARLLADWNQTKLRREENEWYENRRILQKQLSASAQVVPPSPSNIYVRDYRSRDDQTSGRFLQFPSRMKVCNFSNFETVDDAVHARKGIIAKSHFLRKDCVEEQKIEKYDRYLWGRWIAHVILDHFRVIGSDDASCDFKGFFFFFFSLRWTWQSRFLYMMGSSSSKWDT